jgi:copper transport protein
VLAAFAVTAGATAASAHADLASSDPANGAVLATAPSRVVLTFTEAADPTLSTISVLGSGGTALQTGPVAALAPETLSVSMPSGVADGPYTVAWRAVSADDGHVTAGAFSFSVGAAAPSGSGATPVPVETASGPSTLSIVAKVLLYLGLMLLVAIPVLWVGVFRQPATRARAGIEVVALAALAGSLLLVADEARSVGVSTRGLLETSTGRPLVWLLIAVAVTDLLAAAWLLRPRTTLLVATAIGAAVAMSVHVLGGHASAGATPWLAETLQSVHMLAAGLWVGGLVLLLVVVRGAATTPVTQAERFSRLALPAVVVIVATGVLRAIQQLGGFGELRRGLDSSYGAILLVKVALVLLLIAAGAWNRRREIPSLETHPKGLRRIVTGEVVVAAGVVVLTAGLTGLNPPAAPPPTASPAAPAGLVATGSDVATTMKVTLTATPGAPGLNRFTVAVRDDDTGAPVAADAVSLTLSSITRPEVPPVSLDLARQGDLWATTSSALSLAGTWTAAVQVLAGATATDVPATLVTRDPAASSSTSPPTADIPTVTTTTFPGGAQLQTFVDPAAAGAAQVHVTAYAADGSELSITDPAVVAIPPSGQPQLLDLLKAGKGHVVGNVLTTPGDWRFDVACVEAVTGATLQATIERSVTGASG